MCIGPIRTVDLNKPADSISASRVATEGSWEQRWHPLLHEWVIVSAHRQNRPWTGESIGGGTSDQPSYQSSCYLCPGNRRIGGAVNPAYDGVYVFDNDRPSISLDAPKSLKEPSGIYRNQPATGIARVLCYSPLHNLTMAELNAAQVLSVVSQWQQQTRELATCSAITSVNIFENKGEMCGMSNPHPHGQIYATNFVYKTIEQHLKAAHEHKKEHGRVLFADILEAENKDGSRIIAQNETMIAFVPYFARFAYEVYLAPQRTVATVSELNDAETIDLSSILREVLIRMDNLWSMPFPYLMMLHQAPLRHTDNALFHFHIQLYPPLRTAQLRKYVAAHEIGGGNFLADTIPEEKAADLRSSSSVHYKVRGNS